RGPDDVPLADRRSNVSSYDNPPTGRRALATAEWEAPVVQYRRPPHPVGPGVCRHRLRQPLLPDHLAGSPPTEAPARRPDVSARTPTGGVDPHPRTGYHRR